jgi:uncharacterized Zn-finger protein
MYNLISDEVIMNSAQIPACQSTEIKVTKKDLPLSCPMPNMQLWNGHPKVYLPIEESGQETCPYCGTHYILSNVND